MDRVGICDRMPARCSKISHIPFSEECELCLRDDEDDLTHEFRSLTPAQRQSASSPCALSLPGSHAASPKVEPLFTPHLSPNRSDMSPLSPPRFAIAGVHSDNRGGTASVEPDHASTCPHRGKLYLSSVQAMFLLGSGENVYDVGAVLSCLPAVNSDVSELAKKANIKHHSYFLLDDNDALSVRLGDGSPATSPRLGAKQQQQHVDDTIFNRFMDGPALRSALQFIHSNRLANRNVLVHCDGGVLRSPATVIAYLMAYTNRSLIDASAVVKRSRSVVHVRLLEDSLQALESSLHNSSANSHQSINFTGERSSFDLGGAAATIQVPETEYHAPKLLRPSTTDATGELRSPALLSTTRAPCGPLEDSCEDDGFHLTQHPFEALASGGAAPSCADDRATTNTECTPQLFAASTATQRSTPSRAFVTGTLAAVTLANSSGVPTKTLAKPFLSVRID